MKRLLLPILILLLAAYACGTQSGTPPAASDAPAVASTSTTSPATDIPTLLPPTETLLPTDTPTITPTQPNTPTPEPTVSLEKVYQFHGQLLHQTAGSQESVGAFIAEGGPVRTVAFSSDGTLFVMGGQGKYKEDFDEQAGRLYDTVFLFDLTTGLQTWQLNPAKQGSKTVNDLVFHPSSPYLFAVYQDRSVLNWDLENGERENIYQDHRGTANALAISPDGTLLTAAIDHLVRLWSSTRGWAYNKPAPTLSLQVLDATNRMPFYDVAFSPDNTMLAAGTERYILIWNPLNGQEIMTLNEGGLSLAFSPDGATLVAGNSSGITVWDLSNGTARYSISTSARSLDLAPAGDLLAYTTGSEIILWDMLAQCEVTRLAAHTDWINVVRFSPDGQFLASGSEDMTAIVWKIVR